MVLFYALYAIAVIALDILFLMYKVDITTYLIILVGIFMFMLFARYGAVAAQRKEQNSEKTTPQSQSFSYFMTFRRFCFLSFPPVLCVFLNSFYV